MTLTPQWGEEGRSVSSRQTANVPWEWSVSLSRHGGSVAILYYQERPSRSNGSTASDVVEPLIPPTPTLRGIVVGHAAKIAIVNSPMALITTALTTPRVRRAELSWCRLIPIHGMRHDLPPVTLFTLVAHRRAVGTGVTPLTVDQHANLGA